MKVIKYLPCRIAPVLVLFTTVSLNAWGASSLENAPGFKTYQDYVNVRVQQGADLSAVQDQFEGSFSCRQFLVDPIALQQVKALKLRSSCLKNPNELVQWRGQLEELAIQIDVKYDLPLVGLDDFFMRDFPRLKRFSLILSVKGEDYHHNRREEDFHHHLVSMMGIFRSPALREVRVEALRGWGTERQAKYLNGFLSDFILMSAPLLTPVTHLELIGLPLSGVGARDVVILLDRFKEDLVSLKIDSLSSVELDGEGYELAEKRTAPIYEAIGRLRRLEEVDLGAAQYGGELKLMTCLKPLSRLHLDPERRGLHKLGLHVGVRSSWEPEKRKAELDLLTWVIANHPQLSDLDLSGLGLGKDGLAHISPAIAKLQGLERLNLAGNGLGTEGLALLVQRLHPDARLKELSIAGNGITNYYTGDYGGGDLSISDRQKLAGLEVLSLRGNPLMSQPRGMRWCLDYALRREHRPSILSWFEFAQLKSMDFVVNPVEGAHKKLDKYEPLVISTRQLDYTFGPMNLSQVERASVRIDELPLLMDRKWIWVSKIKHLTLVSYDGSISSGKREAALNLLGLEALKKLLSRPNELESVKIVDTYLQPEAVFDLVAAVPQGGSLKRVILQVDSKYDLDSHRRDENGRGLTRRLKELFASKGIAAEVTSFWE